jgi:hypothetical protein
MADVASAETMKDKKPWNRNMEFWSFLVGVVGIVLAAATFLGWQIEKHKRLDLLYLAKLSFINPDIHSSQKVSVLYDGRPISQLTKISAQIINSGQLQIVKSDFERPSMLQFDPTKARIIEAHIVERNPPGLDTNISIEGNAVRIDHGLLNAGNSFAFEVLLDGDPGATLPTLDSRIAGVEPTTRGIPGDGQPNNLLLSRRRGTQLIIIVITTAVLAFAVFVAFLGAFNTVQTMSFKVDISTEKIAALEARLKPDRVVKNLYYVLPEAMLIPGGAPEESWIEDYKSVLAHTRELPNGEEIARKVYTGMRAGLKEELARGAYLTLPSGVDKYVRREIRAMSFTPETGQSALAFIQAVSLQARNLASNPLPLKARFIVAGEDLALTAIFVFVAPFVTISAVGLWQIYLAGR